MDARYNMHPQNDLTTGHTTELRTCHWILMHTGPRGRYDT